MASATSSGWRAQIIEPIVPAYTTNDRVAAVIVGGSTARGHADRYSDIELGVFWHEPPNEDDRQAAAKAISPAFGDLIRLYPYDPDEEVWSDDFALGRNTAGEPHSGVLLEVVHHTTDFVERTFEEVQTKHNPDLLKQNLIAGIGDGHVLYNPALVEDWQGRARDYPDELADAVVRRYAQIDHFWRWQMWLERSNNLLMLYQSFVQVQTRLLHTLLGLNRVYYFGFKWLDGVDDRLERKPVDLVPRLAEVYEAEPTIGAQLLAELVEETYDLIEVHMPDADIEWLRSVFRYQRPVWAERPPSP